MQLEFDLTPEPQLCRDLELEKLYLAVKRQWIDCQPKYRYSSSILRAEKHMFDGMYDREAILYELNQLQIWLNNMKDYSWCQS